MKITKKVLGILFLLLISPKLTLAGGFTVSSIGGVSTNNIQVSKFWHTSLQPTFRGTALPSSNVTIDIDGTAIQVAADSSGDWVYTPAASLTTGAHQVTFTNNGSTQKITLTLGDLSGMDVGGISSSTSATPAAGVTWPTVLILSLGGFSIVLGLKYRHAQVLS
ncbi:MAG TPA: Ig-like domain-containing protein [Candidatus Woesebacteria bacterium]|nr:Ig-like domain-containing protein [Candidatus Woesebacteria bacterium]HRS22584.1 Ig-like domain-containing protein [Candidatus Woesebacteria bacterium]HRT39824.1 Ig-like domain-containing protein [Candidatus Woesebacteria bacterium]